MKNYCFRKCPRLLTVLGLFTLLLAGQGTLADIPRTIAHQGRVWDNTSLLPLEGLQDLTFILYQDDVPQWTETLSVNFSDGYYGVILGYQMPIPETIFDSTGISLGITIGDDAELMPRMEMSSVPFAFRAATSDNVTGDITPASIHVGGQIIVDEYGSWVGDNSGLEGPAGPQGPEGPAGIAGPMGPSGPMGLAGPAGPMGPIGPAGADGLDGVNGLQGPQGDPGPQGPAGQKGANWQGIWQTGISYIVDDVVAYNGSSFICIQATTGLEDPANLLYWSLLAERGNDGADGAVGPQGPQGDIGPQGPVGPQGDVGPQGLAGADGAVGPQGPQGDIGPQGPAGIGGLFVTDGNGVNIGAFVESGMSGSFSSPSPDALWLLSDQGYLFSIAVSTGNLLGDAFEVDYEEPDCFGQGYLRDGNVTVTSMSFSFGLVLNSASGVVYSPKETTLTSYSYKSSRKIGVCSNVNGNAKNGQGYPVSTNLPTTTGVPDTITYSTPIGLSKY